MYMHNFVKMHEGSYCPFDFVENYYGNTIIDGLRRWEVETPLSRHNPMMANNDRRSAFDLKDCLQTFIYCIIIIQVKITHFVYNITRIIFIEKARRGTENVEI